MLGDVTAKLPPLLDHLADAAILHDARGVILDVNGEACRSLQRTRAELLGMRVTELDRSAKDDEVEHVLATMQVGDTFTAQTRHHRADGSSFPVEIRLTCAAADQGAVEPVFLAIVRDLTERERAAQEIERLQADLQALVSERTSQLQRSTRLLRAVLENAPDAIFVKDRDGRYLLCNPAVCGFLGKTEQEILGHHDRELFHEGAQQVIDHDLRVMQDARSHQFEEVATSDGVERVYMTQKTPFFDEDGNVVGLIGISRDVTAMRRAERELTDNLLRAKESATHAEQMKSSFLAAASHELRTPLNGILGVTELLLDSPLSSRQREAIQLVQRSGDNLLLLVDDLLDSARIEAGKLLLRSNTFSLREILADVFALLANDAERKQLALRYSDAGLVDDRMFGDPARLRQILINLIANAIKFTPKGHVMVRLRHVGGGDTVRIEVEDTGPGIAESLSTSIFEPFTRAPSSDRTQVGGSGLGLTICRQLALLMGGSIGLDSTLGRGSTFWVELPRIAPVHEDDSPESKPLQVRTAFDYRPLRMLLVEDNEPNRQVATLMLEHFGHTVRHAVNGQHALEVMAQTGFDVVLMDCEMPELDGYETTKRIRAQELAANLAPLPIIALTASGLPETRERCAVAGMTAYVRKPLRRAELARVFASCRLTLINPHWSAQDGQSTDHVLDADHVAELRDVRRPDGSTLFDQLADLLLQEMPARLESLSSFVAQRDAEQLERLAHKVAGGCASVGATTLYACAQALELAANENAWDRIGTLLERTDAAWLDLEKELRKRPA